MNEDLINRGLKVAKEGCLEYHGMWVLTRKGYQVFL
jgi:hypothetical protein